MWYPGFIAQYKKSTKEQQGLYLSHINALTPLEKKEGTRKQSGKNKHKG